MESLFKDLPAEIQAKIIDQRRYASVDYLWWDSTYEYIEEVGSAIGIDLSYRDNNVPDIRFSGFYSQGDGSLFNAAFNVDQFALARAKCKAEFGAENESLNELVQMVETLYTNLLAFEFKQKCQVDLDDGDKIQFIGNNAYHDVRVSMKSFFSYDVQYYPFSTDEFPHHEDFLELAKAFNAWIYKRLEEEYDYLTSDEYTKEWLTETTTLFNEEGDEV